ncbi:MAG: bifunctional acetate--CoA ligase family protein/GNAT family N-acetyltransferase [Acidobacteria bacterium]|nr:bifunctional acetate--CoA ligase family protein/GNAT family N-acetyltransferase [Acidobacteriota bacterium]
MSADPVRSEPYRSVAGKPAAVGKKSLIPGLDPAHNILRRGERHPLDVFFKPTSVALIGATEAPASVGRAILWNLLSSPFGGTIFPVNPKRSSVLGIKAYPSVTALPEQPDLAVIAVPAQGVPQVIRECASVGVEGAIIISAGFKEAGAPGAELEEQTLEEARRGGLRLIGPNCMGVMSPLTGLNATFASPIALAGNVAFLSQSGALCSAILDWSLSALVGFSAFVSMGSMADVGWGDLIDYLGYDQRTRSIILYMESIGEARSFLSAARQVALSKPIILMKGGRTEAAAKAAASHTGAMTGSDEVLDAALRRCGVLRVNSISALFYMADVLAKQPRPQGPRLAIVTNAGGPGVLATDTLMDLGDELAKLSQQTMEELDRLLPPHWSHSNPVDILGDASAERYGKAVEIVSRDPNCDGMLVVLAPQSMTDASRAAEQVAACAKLDNKPILASWMGGAQVATGEKVLNRANVPTFPYPDTAVRAFHYMWRYTYNLRGLYETPAMVAHAASRDGEQSDSIIQRARDSGRTLLTEFESKQLLAGYGIPTVPTRTAESENDAVQLANETGYPVVLKLLSTKITHKSDVNGVHLNLDDEAAVRRAYRAIETSVAEKAGREAFLGVTVQPMIRKEGYELILGSSLDPQFGPVLLFGTGGRMVEVFNDHALALPPLNTTLARRMMEQTRIHRALQGIRGQQPVDIAALEQLLVRFSQLVLNEPRIREIDINPLLVSPESLIALDARVLLHGSEVREQDLPRPAIRPYPAQYEGSWTARDGTPLVLRPIRPEDEPLMVRFHQTLSQDSVYRRYFHLVSLDQRVAHDRLIRMCFIDYDREMALVAERQRDIGEKEIVAAGRWIKQPGTDETEMALLVSDAYQHRGIGTELLRRLIEIARAEKIPRMSAEILPENIDMQHICAKLGFILLQSTDDHTVKAVINLSEPRQ